MKFEVHFNSPEEVYEFVKEVQKLDADIDLKDGHITIDAKSLLGVMNLDLRKTFTVESVSAGDDVDNLLKVICQKGE